MSELLKNLETLKETNIGAGIMTRDAAIQCVDEAVEKITTLEGRIRKLEKCIWNYTAYNFAIRFDSYASAANAFISQYEQYQH